MSPRERIGLVLAVVGVLLVIATVIVSVLRIRKPEKDWRELSLRVKSWWFMVVIFFGALLADHRVAILLIGFMSYMALKEYLSLIPFKRQVRRLMFWCYLAIPIQLIWVWNVWYMMFIIFIPVYLFLWLPSRAVITGHTEGFIRSVATLHWGVMLLVYSLSHAAYLLVLPPHVNPQGGGAGLLCFLVLLTQANDILQYLWGKSLGKRKVVPKVSPGKTWAGLIGGVATTTLAGWLLAPWLTPFTGWERWAVGAIIGLAGFAGDVNLSALKRDMGVKDSGSLLPGHGGLLDRVDSLTFAAPLFFHFTIYLHKMWPGIGGGG